MRELSMHILDLAQNSIVAGANRIEIDVIADSVGDRLTIAIKDDGRGMPPELLESVTSPFTTTRTTRRVGLGIPMFNEAARACDGFLIVESEPGVGTTVVAEFKLRHIDRAPLGDMAATMVALIAANPEISFCYVQRVDDREFVLDTDGLKDQLDGVPINEAPVLKWIADYVRENAADV